MRKISMIIILFLLCLLAPDFAFTQTLQDAVVKAKTAYARGAFQEAVSHLDMAASTYATSFENKAVIADAYNEIGEREYAKKNYLNAYECFRKAVKLYPTHKAASQNFWKMKQNFNVAELKNEGAPVTEGTASTAESSTEGTVSDKLKKAEEMLAELEKGKTAPTSESNAAQVELLKKYQEELAKQTELIKRLQENYSKTGGQPIVVSSSASKQEQEMLDNLVKLYENALTARQVNPDIDILVTQMKEYRNMFETQASSNFYLVLIFIGSIAGLIIVIFLTLIILYRIARKRQRQRFAYATDYGIGLDYASPLSLEEKQAQLLSYEPAALTEEAKEGVKAKEKASETDVYRDMIRAERLKEMYNEKKYGALKWETVREYIGELEKELRSEILYVVETKINSGNLEDYSSIMPVLFPFLTDSDDYLRDKAHHLLTTVAGNREEEREQVALLEDKTGQGRKGKDPLSIAALMKHIDKLKYTKTARREHCISTANYARGMGILLGFSKETQELLYKTALVHDIGYALLDKEKLLEIESKKTLTDEEFDFIRTHSKKGLEYFKGYDLPQEMKDGILYHHERNDGSGYPKGLKGKEIPDFAKIVGIAESFDALTTSRVFRDKMSFDSAVIIMRDLGRNKFEEEYVKVLIEYLKRSGKIKR